jgi:DeoR/GlpR family transcriptional regulator of sugar metabolism
MSANKHSVPAQVRLEKIRELLRDEPSVSIARLSRLFKVTQMTIHRDLARLERANAVCKMHGGVRAAQRMIFEFDFASRRSANLKAKQAIAAEALKIVKPGDRLILDTGTTTLELAYLLKDMSNLTVITPSLAVASVLQFSTGIQTILLGGVIREGSPDLTGAVTEATLDMFAADIAFQGADGIGLDGTIYNSDIRLARVDQKMRTRASRCCILADGSKFGKTALARMCNVGDVDSLITDTGAPREYISEFHKLGANVIIAK